MDRPLSLYACFLLFGFFEIGFLVLYGVTCLLHSASKGCQSFGALLLGCEEYDAVLLAVGSTVARDMQTVPCWAEDFTEIPCQQPLLGRVQKG